MNSEVNYEDINLVGKNRSGNQANGKKLDYDKDFIYYINDFKLYSIDRKGVNNKLLFDQWYVYKLELYKDKIYLSFRDKENIGVCSINKDGTDLKTIIVVNINSSSIYKGFILHNDYLYYFLENSDLLNEVYRYNIISCKPDNDFSFDYVGYISEPIIYDEKIYFCGTNNDLIEYDGNEHIRHMEFNKNLYEENYAASVQIMNDYVYYNSKTRISRDSINVLINSEIIFENNDFLISYINVTEDYIFFINRINNYEQNNTDVEIYRIKHDGSDMQKIFEEEFELTNIGPQFIYVIDNVLIYSNQITNEIKLMDYDGNIISWNL